MERAQKVEIDPKTPSPQPALLQTKVWALLIAIFIVLELGIHVFAPIPKIQASDLTLQNILSAVNRERTLRDLSTLREDNRLDTAAQQKSDDMLARHYFSHTDPEGNYIWPKIAAAGYSPYLQLGENLAIEFTDTQSLVSAWMNSPTHRANVLNTGFKDQGMGLAFGNAQDGQYYSAVTNTFGTLLPKKTVTQKAPTPQPAPVAQTPQTTKPAAKPTSKKPTTKTPAPTAPAPTPVPPAPAQPAPTATTPYKPVAIRGELAQNFTVGKQETAATTATSSLRTAPAVIPPAAAALKKPIMDFYKLNRYSVFVFGLILAMLIVFDVRLAIREGKKSWDKKINNLVVLILALIVVILIYWM